MSFDESTGDIFYGDVQCDIKKMNINNVNKGDVSLTINFWNADPDTLNL